MRGNRRWYGGPVWALVMMLALVVSSYAPVVLAEPATPGAEEQEVPAPEIQVETPAENPVPPDSSAGGDGDTYEESVGDLPDSDEQSMSSETDDPILDIPEEPGSSEPADDPIVDIPGEEGEPESTEAPLEPTEAAQDEVSEPVMSLLAAPADIGVSLVTTYADIAPGGTMIYSMTVVNNGKETAENVSIRLVLGWYSATGWAYSYGSSAPGVSASSCSDEMIAGSWTHIDCKIAGLQPGMTATFDMLSHTDTADMEQYCGAGLDGTAEVVSVDEAPGAAMAGPVYTMVTCEDASEPASDIDVSLSSPAEIELGDVLSYTMTGVNTGDGAAGEVRFSFSRPIDTGQSWTYQVTSNHGGSVTCSFNIVTGGAGCVARDLEPGDVVTVVFSSGTNLMTDDACGWVIDHQAWVTWVDGVSGYRPEWGSNIVQTTFICEDVTEPASDIDISLSGSAEIELGDELSYTMTVQNVGDATAGEVRFALGFELDTQQAWTPQVITGHGGDLNCVYTASANLVSCIALNVEPGDVMTVAVSSPTDLVDSALCGTSVSERANVIWVDGVTGASGWGSNLVQTTIVCEEETADVSISLVGPAQVGLGGTLGYTMTVENTGTETFGWLQFHLQPVLDTGEPWVPMVVTNHGGDLNCSYDDGLELAFCNALDVEPGDVIAVAVSSQTDLVSPDRCGETISQQAQVFSVDGVALPTTWSNTVDTEIVCDGTSPDDITIGLSGPSVVQRGDTFTYEMTITNTGAETANELRTNATLQNTGAAWTGTLTGADPAIGAFPGDGGDCAFAGVSLTCTIFGLEPGGSVTIAMSSPTDTLDSIFCATTRDQTASVIWVDGQTPGATSNTVTTEIDCGAEPEDMSISLTGDEVVYTGEIVTYTMVVTNNGDEMANEVRFTTAGLPSTGSNWGWTSPDVDEDLDGCNYIPSLPPVVACTFLAIAPGESVSVMVESSTEFADEAICGTTWEQLAAVVWVDGQVISDTWSNAVTTEFRCGQVPTPDPYEVLTITKTGPATIERGEALEYVITVTNTSTADIAGVRVADTWLPLTTGYDWTVEATGLVTGNCVLPASTNLLNCFNLTLPAGASLVVTVTSAGTDLEATVCQVQNNAHISNVEGVVLQPAIFSNMVYTTFDGCEDPPATPGTPPATPGTPPATPGTPPATPPATPGTPPATPGTPPATPGTPPATPTETVEPTETVPVDPTATEDPTVTVTPDGTATEDPAHTETPDPGNAGESTMVAGLPGTTPVGTSPGEDGKPVAGLPVTGQGAMAGSTPLTPFLLMAAVLLAAAGHRVRTMTFDARPRR